MGARCTAYVRGMGINPQHLEPKHIAWLVGDAALSVNQLDAIGAGNVPVSDWASLLPEMEKALCFNLTKMPIKKADISAKLIGFIGARGIATSSLKTPDDWWTVAEILWPDCIMRENDSSLFDLEDQISSMSKTQRKKARDRFSLVPVHFLASQSNGKKVPS